MGNRKVWGVPTYADVMTAEEWLSAVRVGAFMPSDGMGYWCPNDHEECPDHDCFNPKPEWATHVAWYNK